MIYLATYLIVGGIAFVLVPRVALALFGSTGSDGDIMRRVVGMFVVALGGLVAQFVRRRDFAYYAYSVYGHSAMVAFMVFLYSRSRDLLFLVLLCIVLVGLIPSIYVHVRERALSE
jgi:uncharacterized protein YjeT (DUF2065 family)